MDIQETIAAKRDDEELDPEQLREFVLAYVKGDVDDEQMAAFLMAGYLQGFSDEETDELTKAMLDSGERLDLSGLSGPTVDKHSTGGVSDATTLIVAPLAAELGMQTVKLSGRGLGHTGGTLDKLESIPTMRTDLSREEMLAQVEDIGLCVCAQTGDLVPADRMMYALRDATATVGSIPLIASSVMSKKLAGGAEAILLDVKVGSGAFMKDEDAARELAETCVAIGERAGRATGALISDMSQPLGEAVGNAIEVREAIEVLRGERPGRLLEQSLDLVAHLGVLSGCFDEVGEAREAAAKALDQGDGLERFRRFVEAQGGDGKVVEDLSILPEAPVSCEIEAPSDGTLTATDAEALGLAAAGLGAGRSRKDDEIDPAVGFELGLKIGGAASEGEAIGRVFAAEEDAADEAIEAILAALEFGDEPVEEPELRKATVGMRRRSAHGATRAR
jgi:pyrimidine-nucleoside phosphorylase